jgi:hypothetical protein
VGLQRYQKSRLAPESRHAVLSSWIQNNTYTLIIRSNISIVDVLVQSYAPQPNYLHRTISVSELLPPVSSSYLASLGQTVNDWDFHAGRLKEEDLIYASVLILEHILDTGGPELSPFKISRGPTSLNITDHR